MNWCSQECEHGTHECVRHAKVPQTTTKTLLHYALPYWRRLALIVVLSLISTALSLILPYLSKALIDRGLIGRDTHALYVIVSLFAGITIVSFALNVVSGLRYTGTSAQILFDMRLVALPPSAAIVAAFLRANASGRNREPHQ